MDTLRELWILAIAIVGTIVPIATLSTKAKLWMKAAAVGFGIGVFGLSIYLFVQTGRDLTNTLLCSAFPNSPGCVAQSFGVKTPNVAVEKFTAPPFSAQEKWQLKRTLESGCTDVPTTAYSECNVVAVQWSPDGRYLASVVDDEAVRIWRDNSDSPYASLDGLSPSSFAWSSDSGRAAIGSNTGKTTVRSIKEIGKPTATLQSKFGVAYLSFSPDGLYILVGSSALTEGYAALWNSYVGTPLAEMLISPDTVADVAWSPIGPRIATGSTFDSMVRLHAEEEFSLPIVLSGHSADVKGVAWSPDRKLVASAGEEGVGFVWDAAGKLRPSPLLGHTDELTSIAWSPDGTRVATGSLDKSARIWSPAPNKGSVVIEVGSAVTTVAFRPNGEQLATGSSDGLIRVWEIVH